MRTTALIFPAPGQAELADLDLPDPQDADVVVRLEASGISVGTERWALLGRRPEIAFPNVPGYMGIGVILETGAGAAARGWKAGQRINFSGSRLPAPYGGNSWMGTHLAHAVVDVCSGSGDNPAGPAFFHAAPVPDGLDPLDAALTQLGAVALRGIEMATIPAGSTVLVVGAGVLGQFAAQTARLKGAQVMIADVQPDRLAIAARCGADWTVDSGREDLAARAAAIAPRGFDIIIDTASVPAVVNAVVPLLRTWGTMVFQGWYPPPSALDLNALHQRLPTCHFPCGHTAAHVATAMRWARDGRLAVRPLLTRVVRPAEAPAFYRHMAQGSDAFLGAAIDWRNP